MEGRIFIAPQDTIAPPNKQISSGSRNQDAAAESKRRRLAKSLGAARGGKIRELSWRKYLPEIAEIPTTPLVFPPSERERGNRSTTTRELIAAIIQWPMLSNLALQFRARGSPAVLLRKRSARANKVQFVRAMIDWANCVVDEISC